MSKANGKSTTTSTSRANPDAGLFAIIERYGWLMSETDRLYGLGGDDATYSPEYRAIDEEAMELENRIVATRANTRKGLRAKLRFIRETRFVNDEPGFETGVLKELVEMILQLDAEAIGVSKKAKGTTASKHTVVPADAERIATG